MEYITNKLPYCPGMTRNAKVGGYLFKLLPIYMCGGRTFIAMFEEYHETQKNLGEESLGRQTFCELARFLTKPGDTPARIKVYRRRSRAIATRRGGPQAGTSSHSDYVIPFVALFR